MRTWSRYSSLIHIRRLTLRVGPQPEGQGMVRLVAFLPRPSPADEAPAHQ